MLLIIFFSYLTNSYAENNTDAIVFVKFDHAEANYEPTSTQQETMTTTTEATTVSTTEIEIPIIEEGPETVLFVPNERPVIRNEDYPDQSLKVQDIMMMKTVGDVDDKNFHVETEPPLEDVVFVTGKNVEIIDEPPKKKKTEYNRRMSETEMETPRTKPKILDCSNLDCNNTINSTCGGKMEHNTWKYRLFMNDCYFRKVNCNFKYEVNRYKLVPREKCSNIGIHGAAFSFRPKPDIPEKSDKIDIVQKNTLSRRSLTKSVNGQFCSHPCPVSCPDDYDPECAVSGTGQRRVFVNHCKLDFNSCSYGVVWHRRPLSECVGGKKADMQQNKGFIGWMRRVGIVDKKGRLVLN